MDRILILGGGVGGTLTANLLARKNGKGACKGIDPRRGGLRGSIFVRSEQLAYFNLKFALMDVPSAAVTVTT